MPVVKTPSSSLPASPRVGYNKRLDLERVFNNLSNNSNNVGGSPLTQNNINHQHPRLMNNQTTKELTSELAQLHSLGAELRVGLLKAVEALRLVQSNDEAMRNQLETANAQTQKSISELTRVVSSVQDDSNSLRVKFETLDNSNREMRQKIAELEQLCRSLSQQQQQQTASVPELPSFLQTPTNTSPSLNGGCSSNNSTTSGGGGLQEPTASKFHQHFITFMTAEVHFCRTVGKMCQQQQQAVTLLQARRSNATAGGSLSPTPSETLATILPASLWQVYRVHADFLVQLEARMAKWNLWNCVGDVFLRLLDNKSSHFADIYKLYANELLSIFGAGGSPVCAPLLLPFRRLADYVGFLETARQTLLDPDHPDVYNVMKSIEKLRNIITRLNEQQLRFLLVADNVAPVGNGTNFSQKSSTLTSKPINQKITNGCATIARTRYQQNAKNEMAKKKANSQLMLKSRSHGDLYVAAAQEEFQSQQQQQQQQQDFTMMGHCSDPTSDDGDGDDTADLLSPVNYNEIFDGDIYLGSRSLPRTRLQQQMMLRRNFQSQQHHHHGNRSEEMAESVQDCWTSKAGTMTSFTTTTATAASAGRPCSVQTSSATADMMGDLQQSIPPMPHRSCETANPSRYMMQQRNLFGPPLTSSGHGALSSGSSGSGSTSAKIGPSSTYQPLESVKQSLLNLFQGYKKKKRPGLRNAKQSSTQSSNTPQIRILSPPIMQSSMLHNQQQSFNLLTSSNVHFDIRDQRRAGNAQINCGTSTGSSGAGSDSHMPSPPSSPPSSNNNLGILPLDNHGKSHIINSA